MLPLYSEVFDPLLTEDVETLLSLFQETESVRYNVFSALWRHLSFSDVFLGLSNYGELMRFSRIAMATAAKYFLPPYSYQIRVGSLYLMFGFYHTQPCRPHLKIRLALGSWSHVLKFLKDSADASNFDVLYIFNKLVAAKAFHYTAMPHFLAYRRKRKKNNNMCAEVLGRASAIQELLTTDLLQEVALVQTYYEQLKEATEEVKGKVTMIHKDLSSSLQDAMTEFITWREKKVPKSAKTKEEEEESSSHKAKLISSIKDKSYSNFQETSRSRRHRQVQVVKTLPSTPEKQRENLFPCKKRPESLKARTNKILRDLQEDPKHHSCTLKKPQVVQDGRIDGGGPVEGRRRT